MRVAEVVEGYVGRNRELPTGREQIPLPVPTHARGEWGDRDLSQGLRGIRHDAGKVDPRGPPEALARHASSEGRVEREERGDESRKAPTAAVAAKPLAEEAPRRRRIAHRRDDHELAVAPSEGLAGGLGHPSPSGIAFRGPGDGQAIYEQQRRASLRLELLVRELREVHNLVCDIQQPCVAVAQQALPKGLLGLFRPGDQRRRDRHALAGEQVEQLVGHAARRGGKHLAIAVQAASDANAGKEDPQVIEDLRCRPHRRSGIRHGVALRDRDGRRQVRDRVHLGSRQPLEELARVGRERAHVAPLAFCVERVEGEGRLAGAGDPCDDGPLPQGNATAHALEVVRPRVLDPDLGLGHLGLRRPGLPARSRFSRWDQSSPRSACRLAACA